MPIAEISQRDEIDAGLLLDTQRKLRDLVLSKNATLKHKHLRDVAAHMLVFMDDFSCCWQLATDAARGELDVDRMDGGLGRPNDETYYPAYVQSVRDDDESLALFAAPMNNRNTAFQAVWNADCPLIFNNVQEDARIDGALREQMCQASAFGKMSSALRYENRAFGIVCADRTHEKGRWSVRDVDYFVELVQKVLSPILYASHLISERGDVRLKKDGLSDAECEVLQLAAEGKSYKEIAFILSKSVSTIDHQLRSARRKYNVHSTPRLVAEFLSNTEPE